MIARNSAALRATTDILKEPITEGGLSLRVQVLPFGGRLVSAEVLLPPGYVEGALALAREFQRNSRQQSNVIDFATRKPVACTSDAFGFDIIRDEAADRNSTEFWLLDASGKRELIEAFVSRARALKAE